LPATHTCCGSYRTLHTTATYPLPLYLPLPHLSTATCHSFARRDSYAGLPATLPRSRLHLPHIIPPFALRTALARAASLDLRLLHTLTTSHLLRGFLYWTAHTKRGCVIRTCCLAMHTAYVSLTAPSLALDLALRLALQQALKRALARTCRTPTAYNSFIAVRVRLHFHA